MDAGVEYCGAFLLTQRPTNVIGTESTRKGHVSTKRAIFQNMWLMNTCQAYLVGKDLGINI
jgi:hypothetical protein